MSKTLTILDKDYKNWIKELSSRYRKSQLKAAVKVNSEMLHFYYDLGGDIVTMKAEQKWGSGFMKNLGIDLREQNPDATCFSDTNIRYMKNFYLLYHSFIEITPQAGAQLKDNEIAPQAGEQIEGNEITPQVGEQLDEHEFSQQVVEKIESDIFSIPWGHHKLLIDKFREEPRKALFYAHESLENGWSRDTLLNFIDSDLYDRQGKALTNFKKTLPAETSDMAQELTKDPYDFAFTGITEKYND